MKNTFIGITLLCASSLMLLQSCTKKDITPGIDRNDGELVECTLSATMDASTKVSFNEGNLQWSSGDKIFVTDANGNPVGTGEFTLTSGEGTTSATFSGSKFLGQTPAHAVYPYSAVTSTTKPYAYSLTPVTGDSTGGYAVMLANMNSGTLNFVGVCSMLKINTGEYGKPDGDPAIKSITVSAKYGDNDAPLVGAFNIDWEGTPSITPASIGTQSSVTMSCTTSETFSPNSAVYIPIFPLGQKNSVDPTFTFEFTNASDAVASVTKDFTAPSNTIKILGTASGLKFKVEPPEGALSGVFSVSATKKVYFAEGNLYCTFDDSGNVIGWDFESEQYYVRHNASYRSKIFPASSVNNIENPGKTMGYFFPCELPTAVAQSSPNGITQKHTTFTNSSDDISQPNLGFTVKGKSGKWRCLTQEEWKYLLEQRTVSSSVRYCFTSITVSNNTIPGLVVFPDDYSGQTTSLTTIPDECLFLPAGGFEASVMFPFRDDYSCGYAASNQSYDNFYNLLYFSQVAGENSLTYQQEYGLAITFRLVFDI